MPLIYCKVLEFLAEELASLQTLKLNKKLVASI